MADSTETTKRVRFFDGQFLQDRDFILEQNYHVDRERRTVRVFGSPGLLTGLTVTQTAAYQLTVSPGNAIDALGRHLVLDQALTLTFPSNQDYTEPFQVVLVYREVQAEIASTGSPGATRWDETPMVGAALPGTPPSVVAPTDAPTTWSNPVVGLGWWTVVKGQFTLTTPPVNAGMRTFGPVGVGTDTPAAKLDVVGEIRSSTALSIGADRGMSGIETDKLAFRTKAGTALTVDAAGNVGIGTTTPENGQTWDRVLDVYGSRYAKLSVRSGQIDGRMLTHTAGYYGSAVGLVLGTHSQHAVSLATNQLTRLTVTSDGNVGIGTTTPASALDVKSTLRVTRPDGSTPFIVHSNGNVGVGLVPSAGYPLEVNGRVRSTVAGGGFIIGTDLGLIEYGTGQLALMKGNNPTLLVNPDGRVGIGTSFPGAQLDVAGTVRTDVGGVDIAGSGGISVTDDFRLMLTANASGALWIDGNGYAGIGTSTPAYRLDVAGDVRAQNSIGFTGSKGGLGLAQYHGGDSLILQTGGRMAVTIDDSSRVGIGVESPYERLEVNGRIKSVPASGGLLIGTDRAIIGDGGTGLAVQTGGATTMFLTGAQQVGIGTTTPAYTLDVATAFRVFQDKGAAFVVHPNGNVGIGINTPNDYRLVVASKIMSQPADGGLVIGNVGALIGTETNKLALQTGGTTALAIDSSQNVGIGTTSPGYRLDVNGKIRSSPVDGAFLIGTDRGIVSVDNVKLGFQTNGKVAMTVDYNGYVGVGTTAPSAPFHVVGRLFTSKVGSDEGGMFVSSDRFFGGIDGGGFQFSTANGQVAAMLNDGSLGLGTTSPDNAQPLSTTGPTLQLNGASAARLKLTTVTNGIDARMQLANVGGGTPYNTGLVFGTFSNNYASFVTNGAPRMTIGITGNVLVGENFGDAYGSGDYDREFSVRSSGTKVSSAVMTKNIDSRWLALESGTGLGSIGAPAGMVLGTASKHPVSIMTNRKAAVVVDGDGHVGIGTGTGTLSNPLSITAGGYHMYLNAAIPSTSAANTIGGRVVFMNAVVNGGDSSWSTLYPTIQLGASGPAASGASGSYGARLVVRPDTTVSPANTIPLVTLESIGYTPNANLAIGDLRSQTVNAQTVKVAGNVGIGTTNPAAPLTIRAASGHVRLEQVFPDQGNPPASVVFLDLVSPSPNGNIWGTATAIRWQATGVRGKADPYSGCRIEAYGNELQLKAADPSNQSFNDFRANTVYASVSGGSDERLKTDVRDLTDAVATVGSLRGVRFSWADGAERYGRRDDGAPAGPSIGVIAQDVAAVLPELVHADPDGMLCVEYPKLTAVLIEAVKEQQAQIAGLRSRLDQLEGAQR